MSVVQTLGRYVVFAAAKAKIYHFKVNQNGISFLAPLLMSVLLLLEGATSLQESNGHQLVIGLVKCGAAIMLFTMEHVMAVRFSLIVLVCSMTQSLVFGHVSLFFALMGCAVGSLALHSLYSSDPSSAENGSFDKTIGLDPFAPESIQHPFPFYKVLRQERPLYHMKSADYWVVSRYKDIQYVTKETSVFSSNLVAILLEAGNGKQSIMSKPDVDVIVDVLALSDPPVHTHQRRIAMGGLSPKLFIKLEDGIREECVRMLDNLLPYSPKTSNQVEWMDAFAMRLPMKVALNLCGLPVNGLLNGKAIHVQVKEWADHGVALLAGVNTAEELANHSIESLNLLTWVKQQFQAILKKPGLPDNSKFLETLVQAVRDEKLSDKEAISMIFQILLAGNDSSASTLGSSVKILLERPDLQELLREKPSQIPAFVEEVLRIESPFGGHFRKAMRDIPLHGVTLKKGSRVMVLWASGNRDPDVFENPDEFIMNRPNISKQLAFGKGIHACLGQKLARIEIKVAIEELLKRADIAWPNNVQPKLEYVNSVFVRSLQQLPVVLKARQSQPLQ